jgi:hypothetical protein
MNMLSVLTFFSMASQLAAFAFILYRVYVTRNKSLLIGLIPLLMYMISIPLGPSQVMPVYEYLLKHNVILMGTGEYVVCVHALCKIGYAVFTILTLYGCSRTNKGV